MAKTISEMSTVMFTDLAGYTETTGKLDRELFSQMHDSFDSLSLPLFRRFKGNVVKKIGDSFLATFKSPTDALLCGMAMQKAFEHFNEDYRPKYPLRVRVAVHTGEILFQDEDIYGDAVNVASRIEELAGPGEIFFSEAAFLAMNKNEVPYLYLGPRIMKGVNYPVRVFRVKGYYDKELRLKRLRAGRRRKIRNFFLTLLMLGLVVLVIYFASWLMMEYFSLGEMLRR